MYICKNDANASSCAYREYFHHWSQWPDLSLWRVFTIKYSSTHCDHWGANQRNCSPTRWSKQFLKILGTVEPSESLKSLLSSKILEKGRPQYPIAFLNSLKVYSLPKVQYRSKKFKLTALEGSLIRKAIFGRFSIQDKPFYSLMTLTNQGEIILFNLDSEKQIILDKRFFIPNLHNS